MQKSESIKNLAEALVNFQAEVKNPANTADNPFFKSKYAPLPDILNDIRPLIAKQGLAIIQSPSGDGDKIVITTILMHKSGEWMEFDPLILRAEKATAQGAGSAITYGRRYALSAVLGISSEDDDDGNHVSGVKKKTDNKQKSQPPARASKPPAAANNEGQRQPSQPPASQVDTEKARAAFFVAINEVANRVGVDNKYAENYAKEILYKKFSVDSLTKLNQGHWAAVKANQGKIMALMEKAFLKVLSEEPAEADTPGGFQGFAPEDIPNLQ